MLDAARSRGVLVFGGGGFGAGRLILLASLGLDLADPGSSTRSSSSTGAARSGSSRSMPDVERFELAHRDEWPTILDESAIVDGNVTYYAVRV